MIVFLFSLFSFPVFAEIIEAPAESLSLNEWFSPYSFNRESTDRYWKPVNGAWEETCSVARVFGQKIEADNIAAMLSHIYYRVLVKPDGSEQIIDQYFFPGNQPTSSATDSNCYTRTKSETPSEFHETATSITCPVAHYYNQRGLPQKSVYIEGIGMYKIEVRHIEIPGATVWKYAQPLPPPPTAPISVNIPEFKRWFADLQNLARSKGFNGGEDFTCQTKFTRIIVSPSGQETQTEVPVGWANTYECGGSWMSFPDKSITANEQGTYNIELRYYGLGQPQPLRRINIGQFSGPQPNSPQGPAKLTFTKDDVVDLYTANPQLLGRYEQSCGGSCITTGTNPPTHNPNIVCLGPVWTEDYNSKTGWNSCVNSHIKISYTLEDHCYALSLQSSGTRLSSIAKTEKTYIFSNFLPINSISIYPSDPIVGEKMECDVESAGQTKIIWYVNWQAVGTGKILQTYSFNKGDRVYCSAVPVVGIFEGEKVNSAEIQLLPQPNIVDSAHIEPYNPSTDDMLSCYIDQSATPPQNFLGWWSGDVNPNGFMGGQTGILKGGTTNVPGKVQEAYSFDGIDDYIALIIPEIDTAPGSYVTVDFWMYWNGSEGSHGQMPFGFDRYDLYFKDGSFGFNTGNTDVWGISSAGLANKWVHVAAVFSNGNGKTNKLYINGVQQTLTQRLGSTASGLVNPNARISGWATGDGYNFGGMIDELEIWNGELTAAQIQSAYQHIQSAGRGSADAAGLVEINWYVNATKVSTSQSLTGDDEAVAAPDFAFKAGDKVACSVIPISGSRMGYETKSKDVVVNNNTNIFVAAYPFVISSGDNSPQPANNASPINGTALATTLGISAIAAGGVYTGLRYQRSSRLPIKTYPKSNGGVIPEGVVGQLKSYTRSLKEDVQKLIEYTGQKLSEIKSRTEALFTSLQEERQMKAEREAAEAGGGIPLIKGNDGYYTRDGKYWSSVPGAQNPWDHPDSVPSVNGMGWTFSGGKVTGRDQPALDQLERLQEKAKNGLLSDTDVDSLEKLTSDPYLNSAVKKDISKTVEQIRTDKQVADDVNALIQNNNGNSTKKSIELYYGLQSIYNRPGINPELKARIKDSMGILKGFIDENEDELVAEQNRYVDMYNDNIIRIKNESSISIRNITRVHNGYPVRIFNSDAITDQQAAQEWKWQLEQQRIQVEKNKQGFLGGLWNNLEGGGKFLTDLTRDALTVSVLPMWTVVDPNGASKWLAEKRDSAISFGHGMWDSFQNGGQFLTNLTRDTLILSNPIVMGGWMLLDRDGFNQYLNDKSNSIGNFLYAGGQVLVNVTRAALVFGTPVWVIWYFADSPGFMQYYNGTSNFITGAATSIWKYCTGSAYGAGNCTGEAIQLLAPMPPIAELANVGKVGKAARAAEALTAVRDVKLTMQMGNGAKKAVEFGDAAITASRVSGGAGDAYRLEMATARSGSARGLAGNILGHEFELNVNEAYRASGAELKFTGEVTRKTVPSFWKKASLFGKVDVDGFFEIGSKRFFVESKFDTLTHIKGKGGVGEFINKYRTTFNRFRSLDKGAGIKWVTTTPKSNMPRNVIKFFEEQGVEVVEVVGYGRLDPNKIPFHKAAFKMGSGGEITAVRSEMSRFLPDLTDEQWVHLAQLVPSLEEGAQKYGVSLNTIIYEKMENSIAMAGYDTLVFDESVPIIDMLEGRVVEHEMGHLWVAQNRFADIKEYADFTSKYYRQTWLTELEADASIKRFVGKQAFNERVKRLVLETGAEMDYIIENKKAFTPRDIEQIISAELLASRTGDRNLARMALGMYDQLLENNIISLSQIRNIRLLLQTWLKNTIDKGRVGDAYLDVGKSIRYGEHLNAENMIELLSHSNQPKQFWWLR